ncbi:coenzyme PQQ biosynthesis protein A [Gluconacetobacter diazotrophicus PA1 5]|nr:coenzyme PQQ biosynthesis protein A [Gluconacetobacter diazotrophicus PA1 5]TWB11086.1 coenzyme PQQ precursor peptide PqqA [Gluconacetobacter diazotrophicus]
MNAGFPAFISQKTEDMMAWTAPKITEVPLGAEINSYVCGQKK